MVEKLPRTPWARHIGFQLVRAATSAGANYQEARHAESRADFVHKLSVGAKELGETLYWLQLLAELRLGGETWRLAQEADELIAILVTSGRTARANDTNGGPAPKS